MKLGILDYIDKTIEKIEENQDKIEEANDYLHSFFKRLTDDEDYCLSVSSRIKSKGSIKEKIIRNNYSQKYESPDLLLENFSDLIGIRLECRFNDDERKLYEFILENFKLEGEGGYFSNQEDDRIFLKLSSKQPEVQKNGFNIYKIDGVYKSSDFKINFELQIKSLVGVFWGEIDHKILYKNYNYLTEETLVRQIMYSIRENLNLIDKQMKFLSDHLAESEAEDLMTSKDMLKSMMIKMLSDQYTKKVQEEVGIMIDFSDPAEIITTYIFDKVKYENKEDYFDEMSKISEALSNEVKTNVHFGEKIFINPNLDFKNEWCKKLSDQMIDAVNVDFNWNLLIQILFDLNKEDPDHEFICFIEYLVYIVIDHIRQGLKRADLDEDRRETWEPVLSNSILEDYINRLDIKNFTQSALDDLTERVTIMAKENADPPRVPIEQKKWMESVIIKQSFRRK